ncbi:MAG: Uncharacterised protein [Marine Group II euryarchaeote MED-G33]|nr:MAG: Uncharacterised protein [Marine Group II euryarchaeote MED-G33]
MSAVQVPSHVPLSSTFVGVTSLNERPDSGIKTSVMSSEMTPHSDGNTCEISPLTVTIPAIISMSDVLAV